MVKYRSDNQIDIRTMAERCRISMGLLRMLEEGEVSAPSIAQRVGEAYGLTELETEDLMPLNYRLHGGDYEPDRYVEPDPHTLYHDKEYLAMLAATKGEDK